MRASGSDRRFRGVTLALVAGCLLLASALPTSRADDASSSFDALLLRFRRLRGLEASFREEKSIALLREPVVSEGRIYFAPPSRLARHVTSPVRSSMVLDGDQLVFGDRNGSEVLDLRAHPEARVFVDAFRAVLAGDGTAIERRFTTTFASGGGQGWSLVLVPREASARRMLRSVRMTGIDVRLSTLDVEEPSGDVARTRFSAVNTSRTFSRADIRRLFRVGGS